MNPQAKPKATEQRLEEIRKRAAENAQLNGAVQSSAVLDAVSDAVPNNARPQSHPESSYYGLPVLKAPVWTWEVPLYFFFGGIAGVAACLGFVAQVFHSNPALIRMCLWMALAGAAICPILLIADLGRPSRFLNMLRVFKLRSPMSVGAWLLAAFSGCAFLATLCFELLLRGYAISFLHSMLWLAEGSAAITGLLLASYTGVLIGATVIPVWSENRTLLPAHFLASGLGCSAAYLELAGFLVPATQVLGLVASGAETLMGIYLEIRNRPVDAPLHRGWCGKTFLLAGLLEGPVAFFLRVFWGHAAAGRYAAAVCFIIGALISRYAWIWAGRISAHDPHALFALQHKGYPKGF
jgi:hypothetical protein